MRFNPLPKTPKAFARRKICPRSGAPVLSMVDSAEGLGHGPNRSDEREQIQWQLGTVWQIFRRDGGRIHVLSAKFVPLPLDPGTLRQHATGLDRAGPAPLRRRCAMDVRDRSADRHGPNQKVTDLRNLAIRCGPASTGA